MSHSVNPYNLKKIREYSFITDNELTDSLNKTSVSYQQWKNTSLETRKALGENLSKLLAQEKQCLACLIVAEMGKPLSEALLEIEKCIVLVNYVTAHFDEFLKDEVLDETTLINYSPVGAVLGVMPWNFPFWQVFRYAFPVIMGGNIALLKHAPNTFGCGLEIEMLFEKAGFLQGVFTNLIIDTSQVEKVIAHKNTQGVCVTGSTKAGSAVASLAGSYLKKSVLELGGTDACVLLKNANLELALTHTFKARMVNAGQVCIAPKRIFVPKEKLEEVVVFFKQKIDEIVLGDPLEKTTTMGPISKASFLHIIEKQVQKAIDNGAELIVGGTAKTPFFKPTLLVVNSGNTILQEEIFGPVLCVIPYENEEKLLQEVNKSDYGLGTAIWTEDIALAKEWATKVEVGFVAINKIVKSDVRYPFGGVKQSGYGKELGKAGFLTFLNTKTISTAN